LLLLKKTRCVLTYLKNIPVAAGLKKELSSPAVYKELQKSLTPEEISSLKQTVTSAYYTPAELVKFIYGWLQVYGFTGGDILEPSIGHGVFMEHIPQEIRDHSRITALDIDPISSRIVNRLYPDVSLYMQGFETWNTEPRFDLVIGNPPCGSQILTDEHHSDLKSFFVHHYFVAKGIRLLKGLKPGTLETMQ
jgi:predicted RNA methylase